MCFVGISDQTAIISLFDSYWLVFVTERGHVYCAVWSEYLNVIQVQQSFCDADGPVGLAPVNG